jgi:hypothetical protein
MDQSTSIDPMSEGTSIPTTSFISSGPSISYDFGGPSVSVGCQSLSGLFSGASMSPSLFHYPPWTTGMPGMHDMSSTTLSNIRQIPQTTIAPVSSTQPIYSQQLPLTSGINVHSSLGQSIPTNMGQISIRSMVSGGKPLPGSSSSIGGKPLPGSSSSTGGKPLPRLSSLTGGKTFLGSSLPTWGKYFLGSSFIPGIGQQIPGFGQKPYGFGQQSPLGFGQQPPGFGQQPPSFDQQYPPRFVQQPPGFGQQYPPGLAKNLLSLDLANNLFPDLVNNLHS